VTDNNHRQAADIVAVVLAVGLTLTVNFIAFGVVYDAIRSKGPGLSENATQVLTTAIGGILGLLGGFVGYAFGVRRATERLDSTGRETWTVDPLNISPESERLSAPIPPPTPPPPPKPPADEQATQQWPQREEGT
jgi:hypothetical protein